MALKYVVKKTVFGFDKTKAAKYVARPLLAGTVDYSALCDQVTKVGCSENGDRWSDRCDHVESGKSFVSEAG